MTFTFNSGKASLFRLLNLVRKGWRGFVGVGLLRWRPVRGAKSSRDVKKELAFRAGGGGRATDCLCGTDIQP